MHIRLLFLALCLITSSLFGQDPYHIRITQAEGIPSNAVFDIFQDSKGYIWLASNEGLSRYDGYEFKTYYSPLLSSPSGTKISEDQYHRIWYENFDGYLYYIENDSLHAFRQNTPPGFIPYGIVGENLFVLSMNNVDVYELKNLSFVKSFFIPSREITHSTSNSQYYSLVTKEGLSIFSTRETQKNYEIPDELKQDFPLLVYANDNENLILSRDNKHQIIYKVDYIHGIQKKFEASIGKLIQHISFIDEKYWICTHQGIYTYTTDGKPLNSQAPYFEDYSISKVLKDRQDNYWISTTNKGLLLVPNWNTKIIQDKKNSFTKISPYKEGFLLGTRNSRIVYYDLRCEKQSTFYENEESFPVSLIGHDMESQFTIIENKGVYLLKKGQKKFYYSLALKDFCKIDHAYYAYTSSGNTGLLKITDSDSTSVWDETFKTGTKNNDRMIYLIDQVRGKSITYNPTKNTLYNATNLGLFEILPSGSITELKRQGKPIMASHVISLKNNLFILSNQRNLLLMNEKGEFQDLNTSIGIPASGIKKMKRIDSSLYIVSQKSIVELNLQHEKPSIQTIDLNIGPYAISDIECKGNQLYLIADGNIILTEKTSQKSKPEHLPYFNINGIKVNGENVDLLKENSFNYFENNIEIFYSILSFGKAQDPALYYRINNGKWEKTNHNSRSLTFPALISGNYTIAFKFGENEDTPPLDEIRFTIKSPFWFQWWFIAFIITGVVSILLLYYKIKTDNLVKKNQLITEKIYLEQELSKSILTSIKAQMNPHFLFNALNTIQGYIYADDKLSAGNYLGKFSKLTRLILEMSEKETISLSEEIKALRLYLELEKMRFMDDFEFAISFSEKIDKENTKIPPMLIQPYVENAIKHGLLHKKGEKKLHILFEEKEQYLLVVIDDNGIGRKKSNELNQLKKDRHHSFSTKANEKRLEILNKGKTDKVGIHYIDKTSENGMSLGTCVELSIPYLKSL